MTGICRRIAGATALAVLLVACVGHDVTLAEPDVDPVRKSPALGAGKCSLGAFEFVDARPQQDLGRLGGHVLAYPALAAWVESALRHAARPDSSGSVLVIELNRAYIESHPSGNSFQLVLRARERAGRDTPWRIYRGIESGITWFGNRGEYGQYVEDAGLAATSALIAHEGKCIARRF